MHVVLEMAQCITDQWPLADIMGIRFKVFQIPRLDIWKLFSQFAIGAQKQIPDTGY